MPYLEGSRELTGYTVKLMTRGPFSVRGYTIVAPPGRRGEAQIPQLWDSVIADGRLAKLTRVSRTPTPVLGLGSWDPACPKGGQRYTICIEETADTDFTSLAAECDLFGKRIGASDWLCFQTSLGEEYPGRFWKDNPYQIMGKLGYRFHVAEGDYSIGLHFEAYPPAFSFGSPENTAMEFWITVAKAPPA